MFSDFEAFDMTIEANDIFSLEIVPTNDGANCYIKSFDNRHRYNSVILSSNKNTCVLCEIKFYKSSTTGKYTPRFIFKCIKRNGDPAERIKANIDLSDGDVSIRFWKLVAFLGKFKDIVDRGDFEESYSVVSKDIKVLFEKLGGADKVDFLIGAINSNSLTSDEVGSVVNAARKIVLRRFLHILKNISYSTGSTARETYRERFHIQIPGDEAIWHHFLKNNEWILGINADIRYIKQFIDEAHAGITDTRGKGDPKVDLIGISNYTTLIELKTSDTPIFKSIKGDKSRANTWEFSSDFISGISQCLGQKSEFDIRYESKRIVSKDGNLISKDSTYNRDVRTVFIIGCRYQEFPHDRQSDHISKSETFELFRRNSRNVDIITYDELFERAFYIVTGEKIEEGWYANENFRIV